MLPFDSEDRYDPKEASEDIFWMIVINLLFFATLKGEWHVFKNPRLPLREYEIQKISITGYHYKDPPL